MPRTDTPAGETRVEFIREVWRSGFVRPEVCDPRQRGVLAALSWGFTGRFTYEKAWWRTAYLSIFTGSMSAVDTGIPSDPKECLLYFGNYWTDLQLDAQEILITEIPVGTVEDTTREPVLLHVPMTEHAASPCDVKYTRLLCSWLSFTDGICNPWSRIQTKIIQKCP